MLICSGQTSRERSGPPWSRKIVTQVLLIREKERGVVSKLGEKITGGVGERLKPPVLKTGVHFVDREFESRPLRQNHFKRNVSLIVE